MASNVATNDLKEGIMGRQSLDKRVNGISDWSSVLDPTVARSSTRVGCATAASGTVHAHVLSTLVAPPSMTPVVAINAAVRGASATPLVKPGIARAEK